MTTTSGDDDQAAPASALDLSRFILVDAEEFDGDTLDTDRWIPCYLPQWVDRAHASRYEIGQGVLRLRIDADTEPWAPELDGGIRVSHLQTGVFSGAVDSPIGQHRFRDDLTVRSAQPERRLWLIRYGLLVARVRAIRHPQAMVALWPIGFESRPEDSGEICVFEIFGGEMEAGEGLVGVGVKAHGDPRLHDEFEKVRVDGDLADFHDYAIEWLPRRLRLFIDGRHVKTVDQAIEYPVQLMLDVFDLTDGNERLAAERPFAFEVDHIRHYRPREHDAGT